MLPGPMNQPALGQSSHILQSGPLVKTCLELAVPAWLPGYENLDHRAPESDSPYPFVAVIVFSDIRSLAAEGVENGPQRYPPVGQLVRKIPVESALFELSNYSRPQAGHGFWLPGRLCGPFFVSKQVAKIVIRQQEYSPLP